MKTGRNVRSRVVFRKLAINDLVSCSQSDLLPKAGNRPATTLIQFKQKQCTCTTSTARKRTAEETSTSLVEDAYYLYNQIVKEQDDAPKLKTSSAVAGGQKSLS